MLQPQLDATTLVQEAVFRNNRVKRQLLLYWTQEALGDTTAGARRVDGRGQHICLEQRSLLRHTLSLFQNAASGEVFL